MSEEPSSPDSQYKILQKYSDKLLQDFAINELKIQRPN